MPKQRRSKGRKQYSENERKRAVARVVKSLVLSVERAAKDEIKRHNAAKAVVQKMIRTLEKQERARIAQVKKEERIKREVHSVVRCLVSKTVAAHEPTLNAATAEHKPKKAGAKEAPNSKSDEWEVRWSAPSERLGEQYWWHERTQRAEWYVNRTRTPTAVPADTDDVHRVHPVTGILPDGSLPDGRPKELQSKQQQQQQMSQ